MSTKPKRPTKKERIPIVQRMLFSHTIEEIAKELHVSIATVKRDKAEIVKVAMIQLRDLPKETLAIDFITTLNRVKKRISRLEEKFLASTDSEEMALLSKETRENEKFLNQLYDSAAAVYLKKKIGDENVRQN